ncbi:MAG: O-acetyl-ADP-ribose deacetylase [Actinomycetota bacterium]|nr:O-acetyl-ADP-ribose deacetylase [Actinomycetota bacterium]
MGYLSHMPEIVTVQGDITSQEVDAVVNAANGSLMGGGGVDGAIHRIGGPAILKECRKVRREQYPHGLPTGRAVATTAGRLKAHWVIHTVGPVYSREKEASQLLASCHTASLSLAEELGATEIAFPAISTGIYGYPVEEAAEVAIGAVTTAPSKINKVHFVLFDANTYACYTRAARAAA